jgi:glycerol-3-phosphate acyltransferase PlsY
LGHLFPIWIKFRGGKGIAVLIGSLLAYNPFYGYIFILIWLITAILTKYSSLAALVALISVFIFILFENNSLSVVMSLVLFLIIYKHRTNISRLVKGKESKIILKKEN